MTFRLLADPNPCPGGYSLDCYCDHDNDEHKFNEFPHNFYGSNERECRRQAKAAGWRFHHGGTATCPKCMARKKIEKPAGAFRLEDEA
jgi:hypothetical protein